MANPDPAALRAEILAAIARNQPTRLDPTAAWQPDLNLAALAALDAITDRSKEYAGLILRRRSDGMYAYTVPAPGGKDTFRIAASFNPKLYEIAGIFHNHPGDDEYAPYFSRADIQTSRKLGVPSFIVARDGKVRRFNPTDRGRVQFRDGRLQTLVSGTVIERMPDGLLSQAIED